MPTPSTPKRRLHCTPPPESSGGGMTTVSYGGGLDTDGTGHGVQDGDGFGHPQGDGGVSGARQEEREGACASSRARVGVRCPAVAVGPGPTPQQWGSDDLRAFEPSRRKRGGVGRANHRAEASSGAARSVRRDGRSGRTGLRGIAAIRCRVGARTVCVWGGKPGERRLRRAGEPTCGLGRAIPFDLQRVGRKSGTLRRIVMHARTRTALRCAGRGANLTSRGGARTGAVRGHAGGSEGG
jgi:hypothetical protein